MVENIVNYKAVDNLHMNILDFHLKMRHPVQDKLINDLAPQIDVPSLTTYHYWFALFLYPRYFMELKDIKTFNQSENVDTKTFSSR